jgi:hypothetical protein
MCYWAVGAMSSLSADGLLLVTAFLWSVTFVAQKYAAATMRALAFVAARFEGVLAAFALGWVLILAGAATVEIGPLLRREAVSRAA